jgi:hypothetical protein
MNNDGRRFVVLDEDIELTDGDAAAQNNEKGKEQGAEARANAADVALDAQVGKWEEGKHPRGPDGKFVAGAGEAVKSYGETLGGKKGSAAGLIKHMLASGDFSAGDVFATAKAAFGVDLPGKGYTPESYVKWYHSDMKKKGLNPPPIPKVTKPKAEQEAMKEESDDPDAELGAGPEEKETPEAAKAPAKAAKADWLISQAAKNIIAPVEKLIEDPNFSSPNKAAVKAKLDEINAATAAEYPIAALVKITPMTQSGPMPSTVNAFLAQLEAENGIEPDTATPVEGPKPSAAVKAAAVKAVYAVAKDLPHYETEQAHKYQDAKGQKVRSVFKADTATIDDHGYAKVTAAYGNDPDDAMTPEVCKAMDEYSTVVRKKMSSAEDAAVTSYKGNGYHSINGYLLGKKSGEGGVKEKVDNIRSAIRKTSVPADTPVWRGLTASLKDLTGFDDPAQAVGRCFEHKNFASVSRHFQTSAAFGDKVMLKMTLKAGTPGLVLGGQGTSGEAEIVLDHSSMFRVDKVEQNPYGGDAKHVVHVTYLGVREDG